MERAAYLVRTGIIPRAGDTPIYPKEHTINHPFKTHAWLSRIARICANAAQPDDPFFYLGGPMTGIPQFNFPEFRRVATKLRAEGYNIVSPAELDDPESARAAMESNDGAPGSGSANGEEWEDFLARDVVICALPTCIGAIMLPGWEKSNGARLETFVIDRLKKPVLTYRESGGKPVLVSVDRDALLGPVV